MLCTLPRALYSPHDPHALDTMPVASLRPLRHLYLICATMVFSLCQCILQEWFRNEFLTAQPESATQTWRSAQEMLAKLVEQAALKAEVARVSAVARQEYALKDNVAAAAVKDAAEAVDKGDISNSEFRSYEDAAELADDELEDADEELAKAVEEAKAAKQEVRAAEAAEQMAFEAVGQATARLADDGVTVR